MKALTKEQLKFYENMRYAHGGNDLHGTDCYGLIKLINKREYGIDIGDYERTIPRLACRSIDSFYKQIVKDKVWTPIKTPYTGCTVVLSNTKINDEYLADHVGIYIENNQFLSITLADQFSKISSLENYHVLGYYEFNNLN